MNDEGYQQSTADQLATLRTLLAAERTFSAWIRTGLAAIGGGLAVARVLVVKSPASELLAQAIGALLVVWGSSVFIYASLRYQKTRKRLTDEYQAYSSIDAMNWITVSLLVIAVLVFWITLR